MPDPWFDKFTVLSQDDFVAGDQDELPLCPLTALCNYMAHTEQFRPNVPSLFVSAGQRKNECPKTPFLSGTRFVIHRTYASTSDENCSSLRVRVHKVRNVAASLLFKRNCAAHRVLKVGTLSSQSTFSAFYLRDVTHRHMDTFSIGPLVAAQQDV